jgi:hypothetical protein
MGDAMKGFQSYIPVLRNTKILLALENGATVMYREIKIYKIFPNKTKSEKQ